MRTSQYKRRIDTIKLANFGKIFGNYIIMNNFTK